ncbi:hypothetical protein IFR23_19885 [Sphingomonas sp. CFBP 13603]|uniref:hypothetical protein n=1 Tax=Sphingomonas sp. CFBP 13603 TaxID=2774040 RepID=UPI0018665BE1|nr:hypothetical protein [Sphingomonas sp. CFBP 13603]MBE2994255.1 hypothetical protein [Sphingomonas sp. CFBP 13603]
MPNPPPIEIVDGGVTPPTPDRPGIVRVEMPEGSPPVGTTFVPPTPTPPTPPTPPTQNVTVPPVPTPPAKPTVPVYPRKQARN